MAPARTATGRSRQRAKLEGGPLRRPNRASRPGVQASGAGGLRGGGEAIGGDPRTDAARTPREPTDQEAVERAREGDRKAFQLLVERYQGRAFRLALRVLRDEEQARDAVQEAFLKVYTRLGRFEGRSSFYTWFYRLVMNQCLDMKRRDRSDRRIDWPESDTLEPALEVRVQGAEGRSHEQGPAEHLERSELRREVARAIDQLPDGARETLVLREVEGLSYAEIAEVLGIPKGTVMSRLHYARRRVQAVLAEARVLDGELASEEGPGSPEPLGVRR